jgi:hypothetical protein
MADGGGGAGADAVADGASVPEWEAMQAKTFTKWCNLYLDKRAMQIGAIESDWDDGVRLINLLEVRCACAIMSMMMKVV